MLIRWNAQRLPERSMAASNPIETSLAPTTSKAWSKAPDPLQRDNFVDQEFALKHLEYSERIKERDELLYNMREPSCLTSEMCITIVQRKFACL